MEGSSLAGANELLFKVFQLSSDAIAVTRLDDGRIVDANEAFLRMLGYQRHELIGRTTLELGMWDDPEDRQRLVAQLNRDATTDPLELNLRDRRGEVRTVELSAHIVDLEGVPCIMAIDRDVTERNRREEAFRAQAAEHRRIVETIQEGLWMVDRDFVTTFVNPRMAAMLGREPDEMLGRSVSEFMDEDGWRLAQEYRERRRQGIAEEHDFRFIREDGSEMWAILNAVPIKDDQGAYAGALASVTDVTERRRHEAALRESEERFRVLATFAPVGIYLTDATGESVFLNNRLQEMAGRAATDPIGQGWVEAIHPDDLAPVYNQWYASTRDGRPFAMEYRYLRPDGSVLNVYSSAIPLHSADGRVSGYLGTVVDITDRAQAEDALRAAFDHEHEVARELRALDDMKNTLLEAVSHDIRIPLTTVLGIALTLQRDDLALTQQESRDLLRRLAASAQKLERLVSDLLDLDRIRRGLMSADRRPTDLGELVEAVVRECDLPVDRMVHVDAPAVVSDVDAPKVERIVENLVTNALRHTPAGTPIWVRVESAPGGVLIVVEDAGGGVPEGLRTAVFEPFRQAGTGASNRPGVGIGLALVARFAAMHGGRAWVEEREGGGSSFRVFLPRTDDSRLDLAAS